MNQPVLSVVTVVYNNVNDIRRTMLSVLNQTYCNIEYIIIDGQSTDGTLAVIKEFEDQLAVLVSEKDDGIYHAMNKGLALAKGDYVLFMNSGDEIYALDTVERVFASSPSYADIYYGETEMYDKHLLSQGNRRHKAPRSLDFYSFRYGMSVSHQAIYIRRTLAEPYNLKYQLSADIDWILRALKKSQTIVNTEMYLAKYLIGGMSKKKHYQSLKERFCIFTEHYGLFTTILDHVVIAANLFVYYLKYRKTND